jgi:hypothetical protein
MAKTRPIQPKRSSVASRWPTAGQLQVGELSVNLADRALFSKDESGMVFKFNQTIDATYEIPSFAWTEAGDGTGRYRLAYSISSVRSSSRVDIVPLHSTLEVARAAEIEPYIEVSNGMVTLYAKNRPAGTITIYTRITV